MQQMSQTMRTAATATQQMLPNPAYKLQTLLAAASGSLAFPDYTPEIQDNDDRLRLISELLHKTIKEHSQNHKGTKGIEIEAKLGLVNIFDQEQGSLG